MTRPEEREQLPSDLVDRIRGGEIGAFETLFRATHRGLCAFAARYVNDRARAEELVQDLFADLWAQRTTWVLHGSVRSYLFTAVRNRALNLRKRDAIERDWALDEASPDVRALHPAPESADRQLDRAELQERLDDAFAALPERCRLVMHLRWREGMAYAAIAEVMGISPRTVENQLRRGLDAIRSRLL